MTEAKTFKRRVRERMSKTGEKYTTARAHVAAKRTKKDAATDRPSDASVRTNTGKTWEQWFAILDKAGARKMKHPQIARLLAEQHGVPDWWTQSVTVAYERAHGMRQKHERSGGFAISSSKTVAVPVEVLFRAFVEDRERKEWLGDGSMRLRTAQENRSARFDWEDGSTRVNVGFVDKGAKSTVAVEHERLAGTKDAEMAKVAWKARLNDLKSFLES